jgi:hypothetical protein
MSDEFNLPLSITEDTEENNLPLENNIEKVDNKDDNNDTQNEYLKSTYNKEYISKNKSQSDKEYTYQKNKSAFDKKYVETTEDYHQEGFYCQSCGHFNYVNIQQDTTHSRGRGKGRSRDRGNRRGRYIPKKF